MEVMLKKVRVSWPAIYAPKAMKGDASSNPAYGGKLIVEPDSENDKTLWNAMSKVAEEKWPGKGAQVLAKLIADKRVAYVRGPYLDNDNEPREGFEGMYYLSCRSEKLKPTVKDRFNNTVVESDVGAPYAGCYVHAAVEVYAYDDSAWGRRINCNLQGVMFAADGPAFGGGRPATDSTFAGLAAEVSNEDFV